MKKILALLSVLSLLFSLVGCGDGAGGGRGGSSAGGQGRSSQSAEVESGGPAEGEADIEPPKEDGDADRSPEETAPADPSQPSGPLPGPIGPIAEEEPDVMKMEITVGEKDFSATLYDNAAARALVDMLPMTLDMSELNGNEKYYYLDGSLPTDSGRPAGIHTGDIMLYGGNCLVLFYKSFSTSYSYTLLGRVDDPEGLAAAVGSGDVQISFRKAE